MVGMWAAMSAEHLAVSLAASLVGLRDAKQVDYLVSMLVVMLAFVMAENWVENSVDDLVVMWVVQ